MTAHCGLTSISLMMSDGDHIFMCLWGIWMSSLGKCLLRSSALLFTRFFFLLVLSCMSCLQIFNISPLSEIRFANMFSHSTGCPFVWLMASFAVRKLFSLMESHWPVSALLQGLSLNTWSSRSPVHAGDKEPCTRG